MENLFVAVSACLFLIWSCGGDREKPAPRDLSLRVYSVEFCAGIVEWTARPKGPWQRLKKGDTLRGGQYVRTSHDAAAFLRGNFGDQLFLSEICKVVLDPAFLKKYGGAGKNVRGLQVLSGKAWMDVVKGYGTFVGSTPGGLAMVKGTSFSLSYDSKTKRTRVVVKKGAVAVIDRKAPEKAVELSMGEAIDFSPKQQPIAPRMASPAELNNSLMNIEEELESSAQPSGKSEEKSLGKTRDAGLDKTPAYHTPPAAKNYDNIEQDLEASVPDQARDPQPVGQLETQQDAPAPPPGLPPTGEEKFDDIESQLKQEERGMRNQVKKKKVKDREKDLFNQMEKELESESE